MEDHQDWTPVVLHKRPANAKKENAGSMESSERLRLSRLDASTDVNDVPKKRVAAHTIQMLIRKRMELRINQDKADQVCQFPRHTFRDIESHRILPTPRQQSTIQKMFGIQIRILTITPPSPQLISNE